MEFGNGQNYAYMEGWSIIHFGADMLLINVETTIYLIFPLIFLLGIRRSIQISRKWYLFTDSVSILSKKQYITGTKSSIWNWKSNNKKEEALNYLMILESVPSSLSNVYHKKGRCNFKNLWNSNEWCHTIYKAQLLNK